MNKSTIYLLLMVYIHLTLYVVPNATDEHMGNLTFLAEELLEQLCPAVDICNADTTTAELSPNGELDENRVSCCKGCSCHPDCGDRLNCCYEDELKSNPMYDCLHTSIFHPDVNVPFETPALRTVVNAPPGGCIADEPLKILPGLSVLPSCDEASYFPVYSIVKDEIYKNIQCAHCHGVKDPSLFVPYLTCRNDRRGITSFAEQYKYFETGQLSKRCRIMFKYDTEELLKSKRCYHDVIGTCQSDILKMPRDLDLPNLNIAIIKKLCESSVYSPFTNVRSIYKNVFCAMCGKSSGSKLGLKCLNDVTDRYEEGGFSHLIDQKVLLSQKERPTKINYPKACLYYKNEEVEESCRRLFCPIGKTFSILSKCTFISKWWQSPADFQVLVKLSPMKGQGYRSQVIEMEENVLQDSLAESKPWPADWTIGTVFVRYDKSECDERGTIVLRLLAETSNPTNFMERIERTINLPWSLVIDGRRVAFKQSILEYALKEKTLHSKDRVPAPSRFQNDINLFGCDEIIWKIKSTDKSISLPVNINKLILCRHMVISRVYHGPETDLRH